MARHAYWIEFEIEIEMPSGGRRVEYGDKCKDCDDIISHDNATFKGIYIQSRCKKCEKIRADSKPSRSKEGRKAQYVQWKYGISIEEYRRKEELQLKGCAICKQPCKTGRELAIDHDHKTNFVRDLLCYRCNAVLGLVNDDEDLLFDMLDYLKRHSLKAVG